jgi:anti-sigma B factor antagonist
MMMPKILEATYREIEGITVIKLNGEINGFTQPVMEEVAVQIETGVRDTILLDFSEVAYINSTGIALIVNLLIRAQKVGRRLLACGLSDHYQEIFALTRLADYIRIIKDLDSALKDERVQD